MIFAGDVAIAHGDQFEFLGFPEICRNKPWCINLEGPVVGQDGPPVWGTYNSSAWAESFTGFPLGPIFIGNNHVHDVSNGIQSTQAQVSMLGHRTFGAGSNAEDAARPVTFRGGRYDYVLLGFGWPVIGCLPAGETQAGVNRLEGASVIRQATEALNNAGDARVVVVLHGNYEFERYPQPAHRKLAMQLIDLGVHAVIGHHPHIVGPVERYKGRTIAYSLGNWAFSADRFFDGRLRFPDSSAHQIAIELGDNVDTVHHVRFIPPTTVAYCSAESTLALDFSLTPVFEGFGHVDYLLWFKAHRVKRKGLPLYQDSNDSIANSLRDAWVGIRQFAIDTASRVGLKSMRPGGRHEG
jgi:poly-gamma-glutamate synthesis protein (capsule biosynthesis protein)